MMIKTWLVILSFVFVNSSFAYVISKSENGKDVKWKRNNLELPLLVNIEPVDTEIVLDVSDSAIENFGLTKSEYINSRVYEIFKESLSQWNNKTEYTISPTYTNNLPPVGSGKNTFRFSNNSALFGPGVIAVTSISYGATAGNILSADIIMNQSLTNFVNLSLDETVSSQNYAYLGDVITHEIGHFFGLSHSEVVDSSMIFSVFKNQHEIHSDDLSGLHALYNTPEHNGHIYGKVLAGDSVPVFGVQVEVLSAVTNEVIQAVLTNEEGEFNLYNLPVEDSYYIMISPFQNLSTISPYYQYINNQICFLKNFKPSFYSKCGPRSKGRPQIFFLDSNEPSLDVGSITIRCDENLNTEYFAKKYKTEDREFELMENFDDYSSLFYGYFSTEEVANGLSGDGDEFRIDLSNLDSTDFEETNSVVKVKLNSTGVKTGIDFYLYAKRENELTYTLYNSSLDNTGKKLTQIEIELELSSDSSDNIFDLRIFPFPLTDDEKYEIFSNNNFIENENSIYTISTIVGQKIGSLFVPKEKLDHYPYEDNNLCLEGIVSYSSQAYIPLSSSSDTASQDEENQLGLSCGTISNIDGGGPGNGMSLLIGLLFILLLNPNNKALKTLSKS